MMNESLLPDVKPIPDNYWQLRLKDGTAIDIPPEFVEQVKSLFSKREPIHMKHRTVLYSEIEGYNMIAKRKNDVPLIESAAQAFKEPMYTDDGSVQSRWCKKEVTQSEYQRRFSNLPGYQSLGTSSSGLVVVAFTVPVHLIDVNRVDYCTDDEIRQLTKSN